MAHFGDVLKKSFSVFIVIAIIFVFILGLFLWQKQKEKPTAYMVYTVIAETDKALADKLFAGMCLTDGKSKEAAGRILAITKEEALFEDEKGFYTQADRVTISLKIEAKAQQKNGEYTLNGFTPRAGERVYLYGSIRFEGTCVRVRAI